MIEPVRAAGGIVVRAGAGGPEILLVHRPRYGDWTLPKGKARPDESDAACALREVREETGLVCTALRPVGSVAYTDRDGRPKVVRYWEMVVESGEFEPNREVDETRWLTPAEALALLTYSHDRLLLERYAAEA